MQLQGRAQHPSHAMQHCKGFCTPETLTRRSVSVESMSAKPATCARTKIHVVLSSPQIWGLLASLRMS